MTGSCPFTLVDLSLEGTNFAISGQSITDPVVINTTLGDGLLFADSSVFMLPAQALQIYSTGRIDGERMGLLYALRAFGRRECLGAQRGSRMAGEIRAGDPADVENCSPCAVRRALTAPEGGRHIWIGRATVVLLRMTRPLAVA